MTTRTKRSNHRKLRGFFLALVLLLTACSGLSSSEDAADTATDAVEDAAEVVETSESDDFAMEEEAMEEDAMEDSDDGADRQSAADGLGAGGATGADLTPSDLGRDIIFTAEIGVEVDDVAASGAAATDIIADLGGFVFGQSTVGGAEPRSVITFKVAPNRFSEALEALGTIGELRNQSITTDDVTERVVDLTSRIEVAELGVERLRTAMENAPDLEQFAELEGLLLARESDLEVMRGQLRTIRDRVDLATITLTLSQDRIDNSVRLAVTVYGGHDDGVGCPGNSENVNVPEGDPVTLCFEVTNTGDQTLRDLTITDTVLEIGGNDDLLPVFGSLDELAPGQSAMLALEIAPDRASQPRLRVTGIPTDGLTDEAVGPAVSTAAAFQIRVFEAETDPGFRDGFDAAWDLLKGIWVTLTVLVGFLVPLLIFVPIAWILWKATLPARRRLQAKRDEKAEEGTAPPPPPYAG